MNIKRILMMTAFLLAWGVVAFLLMPVKLMIDQWGVPFGIDVRDPNGTLWNGQAQIAMRVSADERPLSTAVMWEWCPGWGRGLLSACIDAENEVISGTGFVYHSLFGGHLGVEDAMLKIKFSPRFNGWLPLPVALSGGGDIRVSDLHVKTGEYWPEVINARGKLSRMSVNEIELGDYMVNISTGDDKLINADINGGNDAFQVKAQARLSVADRKYRYEARLRSEYPEVRDMIKPFAKSEGDDAYSISGERELP